MASERSRRTRAVGIIGLLTFIYFVAFPDDMTIFSTPIENLHAMRNSIASVLRLTRFSNWFYFLIAALIIAWTIRCRQVASESKQSRNDTPNEEAG